MLSQDHVPELIKFPILILISAHQEPILSRDSWRGRSPRQLSRIEIESESV